MTVFNKIKMSRGYQNLIRRTIQWSYVFCYLCYHLNSWTDVWMLLNGAYWQWFLTMRTSPCASPRNQSKCRKYFKSFNAIKKNNVLLHIKHDILHLCSAASQGCQLSIDYTCIKGIESYFKAQLTNKLHIFIWCPYTNHNVMVVSCQYYLFQKLSLMLVLCVWFYWIKDKVCSFLKLPSDEMKQHVLPWLVRSSLYRFKFYL